MADTTTMHRAALWYNSNEDSEKDDAMRGIAMALEVFAAHHKFELGPIEYVDLPPDHEDLPEPPAGSVEGIRCLTGTAAMRPRTHHVVTPLSGFTHELDPKDLETLRAIHRRHYALAEPADVMENGALTDEECDAGINEIGPEVALAGIDRYKATLH